MNSRSTFYVGHKLKTAFQIQARADICFPQFLLSPLEKRGIRNMKRVKIDCRLDSRFI